MSGNSDVRVIDRFEDLAGQATASQLPDLSAFYQVASAVLSTLASANYASGKILIGQGSAIPAVATVGPRLTLAGGIISADVQSSSTFIASGSGHAGGLVPDPGATAGTTKFLREDATFAIPAASVASGTSGRIPYETTGGVLIDAAALQFNGTSFLLLTNAQNSFRILRAGDGFPVVTCHTDTVQFGVPYRFFAGGTTTSNALLDVDAGGGRIIFRGGGGGAPVADYYAGPAQTGALTNWRAADGTVLSTILLDGSLMPRHISDASAVADSIYFSITSSKLTYKDAGGTPYSLPLILSAVATLDFPSVVANGQAELTISVTGSVVGDSVHLGRPSGLEAGLVATARVTAADTVTVRVSNLTGSAIDPTSANYRATVLRY